MKMKTYFLGITLALCCLTVNAYDFDDSELCYNILSLQDRTLEVAASKYTGDYITIPSKIIYKDKFWDVVKIGNKAFYGSSVKNVEITEGIKTIGDHAFASSKVKTFIPWWVDTSSFTLDSLGGGVFAECNFDALYIPKSIRVIGAGTYYNPYYTDYYDRSGATTTKTLYIEDSEQEVKIRNFCTVANLYIGREIHKPEVNPQDNISGVKVLSIGDKVNKVNSISFKDIDTIMVQNPVPPTLDVEIPNIVFVDAVVYVPDDCIAQYKKDATWGTFFDIRPLSSFPRLESRVIKYKTSDGKPLDDRWNRSIVLDTKGNVLQYVLHEYKDGVGQLIYNDDIAEIKEYFYSSTWTPGFVNSNLEYMEIPYGVTRITDGTFNCLNLKTLVLPETLEELGSYTILGPYNFSDIYSLKTTPPTIKFKENLYGAGTMEASSFHTKMTVHVPIGCKEAYLAAPIWKEMNIVEGTEVSSISTVQTNINRSNSVFYMLDGTKVTTPTTGIYIEKFSDGSTHKVLVK